MDCAEEATYEVQSYLLHYYSYSFKIFMTRRVRYYIINMVILIVILSLVNLCCFLIPTSSGEKMSLCVSTFLTFAIYITIFNETMPKSSTESSAFRVVVLVQTYISGLEIISTSLVLHYHHILVSEIVIWLWSRRITSPKMENAENSFKIDVIRPLNLPFIQEEMTL